MQTISKAPMTLTDTMIACCWELEAALLANPAGFVVVAMREGSIDDTIDGCNDDNGDDEGKRDGIVVGI